MEHAHGAAARGLPAGGGAEHGRLPAIGGRVGGADRAGPAGRGARIPVQRHIAHSPSPQALLSASRGADLLVVGHRGRGGFAGLLLGSVAEQCVRHAACPVLVVRPAI
ncbi:universal stress protein [Saccharopolyspora gregorii]|uniref:universal stress protein n=1 Tax=Saccharopolyspora gregorii TaxID=33914 RepID=UPI0031EF373E